MTQERNVEKMLKKMVLVVMAILAMVGFANISEAASQIPEIHEKVIEVLKTEKADRHITVISLVEIEGQKFLKTEKVYVAQTITEHFIRYANPQTLSIKMAFRWREKNGKYVKSTNDKPVKVVSEKA